MRELVGLALSKARAAERQQKSVEDQVREMETLLKDATLRADMWMSQARQLSGESGYERRDEGRDDRYRDERYRYERSAYPVPYRSTEPYDPYSPAKRSRYDYEQPEAPSTPYQGRSGEGGAGMSTIPDPYARDPYERTRQYGSRR